MKYVTVKMLERLGACSSQINKFKEVFGSKVLINEENFERAIEKGFFVDWLVKTSPKFCASEGIHSILEKRSKIFLKSLLLQVKACTSLSEEDKKTASKGLRRLAKEGRLCSGNSIDCAFFWDQTSEGHGFWDYIYDELEY